MSFYCEYEFLQTTVHTTMNEDQVNAIMARIRARQVEFGGDEAKENEENVNVVEQRKNISESPAKTKTPFGSPTKMNIRAAVPQEKSPVKDMTPKVEQTSARKARFSALAAELDDFECDFQSQGNKPKEAYMKGKSPRMSIGETRPSVLCTPAGNAAMRSPNIATKSASSIKIEPQSPKVEVARDDDKRIKFAHPMVNVNYLPNESSLFSGRSSVNDTVSTVLGGSAEIMNLTTSSLSTTDYSINHHITVENTLINAQSCDNRDVIIRERTMMLNDMTNEEYGAHTFMKKKTTQDEPQVKTPTEKSIHVLVSSPKPFSKEIGKSTFSPVHFTPQSTSSPLPFASKSATTTALSPAKSAAIENACTRVRRMELEEKIRGEKGVVLTPVPASRQPITNTPHVHVTPHQKELFVHEEQKKSSSKLPGGVQTQWRGQHNTPVVQGAKAEDKTAGPEVLGAGSSKLKNLKSRWEFSSATGTPIHPDATEDSLIATAIKMKETAIPTKIGASRNLGKKMTSASASATSIGKSTGYVAQEEDFLNEPEEDPVAGDEEEDEVSEDEIASTDASRIIDQAFDFMDRGSKMGGATPSPYRGEAPLAAFDEDRSPLKKSTRIDVIEEETDVPMGTTTMGEEEEDETTAAGDFVETRVEEKRADEKAWKERSTDSRLPYTVSFYRKIQREHCSEPTYTPIQPSAPPASSHHDFGSAQFLRRLTDTSASAGSTSRIVESEAQTRERIKRAIKVEDEHISQSKRALALCRQTPAFKGSREEIEMQRALLIAVEKQRALLSEFDRLKREGPRIVDGPRGNVELTQLQVNIAKEFVQKCLSSVTQSPDLYYFVAVLKWGEQVEVSKLTTSDEAINRRGVLDFMTPLTLSEIPADFKAVVEIYGQKSQREFFSHEDKYKLKGSTLKTKNAEKWCFYVDKNEQDLRFLKQFQEQEQEKRKNKRMNKLWRRLHTKSSSGSYSMPKQMSYSSTESNFNLLGSFNFDIECPGRKTFQMSHSIFPLEGFATMKVKKRAVDGTDIFYRGFLSMYQRSNEGVGSWTRYWCRMVNGEMKFWKHPEDEGSKAWLVLIDLATCINSEGASTVSDVCPYPNSFHIGVWVPKSEVALREDQTITSIDDIEQLRVMLAADTPHDLQKWLSVINCSSRQLCTWRNPMGPPELQH